MQYYLYNTLIGLSKNHYPTERAAGWNAVNQRDNNPMLQDPELTDSERFVKIVPMDKILTEAERATWTPEFESAW
jgi:hypothetical protein